MSAAMTGRCLCGRVTVTATPDREALIACHCAMCRRWTSGMLMTLQCREGAVRFDGPAKAIASSDFAERGFCGECGSALWYRMTRSGANWYVAAGLFDTGAMPVGMEVFIDRKPQGYALAGERRTFTEAECMAASGLQGEA